MQAAIYARYSSENQRPESIDDQISSCRKLAKERQYDVDQAHIYTDEAASGAREDRPGLGALRAAAVAGEFRVLLIDDLSRLARNTLLLLSVLEELRFHGVRVVSVADGLDTADQDATVGIQMRGVFNELQLMDLRKKVPPQNLWVIDPIPARAALVFVPSLSECVVGDLVDGMPCRSLWETRSVFQGAVGACVHGAGSFHRARGPRSASRLDPETMVVGRPDHWARRRQRDADQDYPESDSETSWVRVWPDGAARGGGHPPARG